MTHRFLRMAGCVALAAVLAGPSLTTQSRPPVSAELASRVAARSLVPVIVEVKADVGVEINLKKLTEVNVNPKVTDLKLDLEDIRLRGGPLFTGEKGEKIAADIKGLLRGAVKAAEPQVRELVNQGIADGIKNGKGALSAAELLKALPK